MLGVILFLAFFLSTEGGRQIEAAESGQLLRLTVLSSYSIKLEWDDVLTGEKGFRIERAVDSEQFMLKAVVSGNIVSYTDYGIVPGRVYTYRVMAIDKNNNVIPYSNEVSLPVSMITCPNSLELTSTHSDRIELLWTYPEYKQYDTIIERREGVKGKWVFAARVPAGIYRYIDTGLAPGVQYFYRIKAATGSSVYSVNYPGDYGKAAYTLLEKPYGLHGNAVSDSQIHIAWEYEGEVTNFLIERKINNGDFSTAGKVSSGNRWFYDMSLSKGNFYTYRIKAIKGGSESAYSDEVTINCMYLSPPIAIYANAVSGTADTILSIINSIPGATGGIPGLMNAITGSINDVPGSMNDTPGSMNNTPCSIIELKWDNSLLDPGIQVEIWRKKEHYGNWELYETLDRNHNRFIDKNIEQGELYSYKLRSVLQYNEAYSGFSNVVSVRVHPCAPPEKVNYTIINENSIMLAWDYAYDRETWFKIEKKEGEDGEWKEIAHLSPGSWVYRVENLPPGGIHFFRIRAFKDVSKSSAYSEEITVTTRVPKAPSGFKAEALSSRQAKLEWTSTLTLPGAWTGKPSYGNGTGGAGGINEEAGFIIERKEAGQEYFKVIAKLEASADSFIDKGLLPYKRYAYKIRAYNKAGFGDYSEEIIVATRRRIFFQDIPPFHPATEAIGELAERGIITGKTDEYFDPEGLISRAEFTSCIIRTFRLDGRRTGSFNDVVYGDDFYDEIMIARSLGIVTGDSRNNFYPDWSLTRGEMAIIIDRVLKAANKALPDDIAGILETRIDTSSVPDYTIPVFAFLVSENVFYMDNNSILLHPEETVTRAEAAMAIYKLMEKLD